jgi:hypothetical protein
MDLLGHQLCSDIAKFYARIEQNPGYITLDADFPIEDAIYRVEKVIEDAQIMIAPADQLLASLQVILRDKKNKGLVPGGEEEAAV